MKTKLYAILRSYDAKGVFGIISRLSSCRTLLESAIIVIDAKRAPPDTAQGIETMDSPFPVQVVMLEHYGWSKALNAAIKSLPNEDFKIPEYIMPVSNEVMIKPENIRKLLELASEEGTSCGYALFKSRFEPSYRVPRNTFAIWKRRLFSSIGLFDETLDRCGGMEDYEMTLRAFSRLRLVPLTPKQRIGLIIRDQGAFPQKIANEENAMKTVESYYSADVIREVRKHLETQFI